MGVRVDQSWNCRDTVGIDGLIRRLTNIVTDGLNDTISNEYGVGLPERTFQLASNQRADIFDQNRRHKRTISEACWQQKRTGWEPAEPEYYAKDGTLTAK